MLTIITINKNNSAGLERTIDSLNIQEDMNFFWILVDGKSIDNSVLKADSFCGGNKLIISEPDLGIYDAMNKGIHFSKNGPVMFLNSGDTLAVRDVTKILNIIWSDDIDIALGGFSVRGKIRFPKINLWRFWSMPTSHQAIFYSRKLLLRFKFDTSFKYAADYEHYLRINKIRLCVVKVRKCLVVNEPYGSDSYLSLVLAEYKQAQLKNNLWPIWANTVLAFKKVYLRRVLK